VRNLLLQLADNKDAAKSVAHLIASNFNKLPENIRNLLFILANKKCAAGFLVAAAAQDYFQLSENVRDQLLLKVANNKHGAQSFQR
jgi:hypothetical protein